MNIENVSKVSCNLDIKLFFITTCPQKCLAYLGEFRIISCWYRGPWNYGVHLRTGDPFLPKVLFHKKLLTGFAFQLHYTIRTTRKAPLAWYSMSLESSSVCKRYFDADMTINGSYLPPHEEASLSIVWPLSIKLGVFSPLILLTTL